jgi:Protein of unknown function (DUF642)
MPVRHVKGKQIDSMTRASFLKAPLAALLCLLASTSVRAATLTYSHDSLNRLTNAVYSDGSRESYSHDAAGNRRMRITLAPTVQIDTVAPSIPSGLATEILFPTERRLVWNRALDTGGSGLAGYFIFTNGAPYGVATTTNLILSGLALDTPYSITISSFDKASNISSPSSPLVFSIPSSGDFRSPLFAGLAFSNGLFHSTLYGSPESNYVIETSSDLTNWTTMFTTNIPLTGFFHFFDSDSPNYPQRFYRALLSTNAEPEPPDLIVNGSFDLPSLGAGADTKFYPPSLDLIGWIVGGTGSPVALINSGARAADGTNDLSFNGGDDGRKGTWIEQTFATTPGAAYTLGFQAGRAGGEPQPVSLEISVRPQNGDALVYFESILASGQGYASVQRTNFTATSELSTVRFTDTTSNPYRIDLLLDNVSVRRATP